MNILLTSSRAPATLELIRVLGQAGHVVHATDTQPFTVGSHSRWLRRHWVTPPPRQAPAAFAERLAAIIQRERIDWLVPTCEEVFYVGQAWERLAQTTQVFTMPLAVLAALHHKGQFQQWAAALGLQTPQTQVVTTTAELQRALGDVPAYLLKPAYGRFATRIITNQGPLAGRTSLAACQPTHVQPWLLQAFVEGTSVCSYSLLHDGHVTAHCAYQTPYQVNHGAGVQFRAVDGAATLAVVQRIGAALSFTGQLSFDFIENAAGLWLLECNPRVTSGVHLMHPEQLVGGLLNPQQPTWSEPPGPPRQLALPLLASVLGRPRRWPTAFHDVLRYGDVIMQRRDPWPALVQFPMTLHVARLAQRHHLSLTQATTWDIEWNGNHTP